MSTPIATSRLCLVTKDSAYIMNTAAKNTLESSGSFILSLAQYLCQSAKLYPEEIIIQQQKEIQTSRINQLREPYFYYQLWCDLFTSLLMSDNIMEVGEQAVIIAEVSIAFLEYVLKSNLFQKLHSFEPKANIKDCIAREVYKMQKYEEFEGKRRDIMVINLSLSVTFKDKTKAKVNIEGLFSGILYRRGDRWRSFKILNEQIPSVEDMIRVDTVVISGSSLSVLNMHPLIQKFQAQLFQALEVNKKLKLLGFCYGHQMIAQALGAKVEKKHVTSGLQYISAPKPHNLGDIAFLSDLGNGENYKIKIYEYHSDYITTVPQKLICIGSSQSCSNEIFLSKDKRIFTFQFHPEYMIEYIRTIEKRWYHQAFVFEGTDQGNKNVDEEHHQTCLQFRKTIRNFMEWQVDS